MALQSYCFDGIVDDMDVDLNDPRGLKRGRDPFLEESLQSKHPKNSNLSLLDAITSCINEAAIILKKEIRTSKHKDKDVAVDKFINSINKILKTSWPPVPTAVTLPLPEIIPPSPSQSQVEFPKFKYSHITAQRITSNPTSVLTTSIKSIGSVPSTPLRSSFHVNLSSPNSKITNLEVFNKIKSNFSPDSNSFKIKGSPNLSSKGKIILHLEDLKSQNTLFNLLSDFISKDNLPGWTVTQSQPPNLKVAIVGVDQSCSTEDILNSVISIFNDANEVKLLHRSSGRLNATEIVLLEVSKRVYTSLISRGRIQIGYYSVRIEEGHYVRPCKNCGDFNHNAKSCRKPPICLYCCENHVSSECPDKASKTKHKCSNCVKNCSSDSSHTAISFKCPSFIEANNQKKIYIFDFNGV